MADFGKSINGEPLHPGRILLAQAMEPLGISRNQLARDIDVPVGRISDITNAKRGITADTALRLGRYFGTGPELWLRLQAEFELYVARKTTWPAVESRVRILQTQQNDAVKPDHTEMRDPDDAAPSADPLPFKEDLELEEDPEFESLTMPVLPDDAMSISRSSEDEQLKADTIDEATEEDLGIPPIPGAPNSIASN